MAVVDPPLNLGNEGDVLLGGDFLGSPLGALLAGNAPGRVDGGFLLNPLEKLRFEQARAAQMQCVPAGLRGQDDMQRALQQQAAGQRAQYDRAQNQGRAAALDDFADQYRADPPLIVMRWEDAVKIFKVIRGSRCPRCVLGCLYRTHPWLDSRVVLCEFCGPVPEHEAIMDNSWKERGNFASTGTPHDEQGILERDGAFHFNLPFPPGAWLGRLIAFMVRLPWELYREMNEKRHNAE